MMNNPLPDRLDRIEDDLETIKDILLTVARRQEGLSEAQDRLSAAQDRTQNQLDQIGYLRSCTILNKLKNPDLPNQKRGVEALSFSIK